MGTLNSYFRFMLIFAYLFIRVDSFHVFYHFTLCSLFSRTATTLNFFFWVYERHNSSDDRVVQSVCLLNCRLGFDSESGQTNDFSIGIDSFPAQRSALKGQ